MPPKSIYRRPGAKHFQLVHRSQRDPLAHDPDASQHVLKAFERDNVARKQQPASVTLAELEAELAVAGPSRVRENLGEAVLYGVDFDDAEYDYMQHLREFGKQEDGVESFLIEAPTTAAQKKKNNAGLRLKDEEQLIPAEALPSKVELARDYERDADAGEAVPSALRGLQPDMDPHLRQTLEALDDDAFVDAELDPDDFFASLVEGGERAADEDPEFAFAEEGAEEHGDQDEEDDELDDSFEARFRRFKKAQAAGNGDASDNDDDGSDLATERADTVSGLPKLPVVGGKRRRKGASDASGYSLSSSSMFRNDGLTNLDERFDKIEKEYEDDDSDEDSDAGSDSDEAPDLIAAREDFNALLDDFLDNYEQVGNKLRPVMAGDTPLAKLDTLRRALDAPRTNRVVRDVVDLDDAPLDRDEKEKDRWDCETILSTYSNLENHPRVIRVRADKPVPKIRLNPKTGLPSVGDAKPSKAHQPPSEDEDEDDEDDAGERRETITRPRNETAEEKKERKRAVKEERQARRAEKKATKEVYAAESRKRVKTLVAQDAGGKMRQI